jgi:hypothetical protein
VFNAPYFKSRSDRGDVALEISFVQATAELPILRQFIDFLNSQAGVYMDCLTSFKGNRVRIELQAARVLKRSPAKRRDGAVMWTSLEDPSQPDIIHQRIIRTPDYVKANANDGFNEQQICWSLIVFIFAFWDEEVRPRIARNRNVQPGDIKINVFGDLRLLRNAIVHNAGTLKQTDFDRLKILQSYCAADQKLTLTHRQMRSLFDDLHRGVASIAFDYAGKFPGAPDLSEIKGIAISGPLSPPIK